VTAVEVRVALVAEADLGEGPVWHSDSDCLLWVDVNAGNVHRFDPATGKDAVFPVGQPVGAVAPTLDRDRLVVAARDGFGILDLTTCQLKMRAPVEAEQADNRMNDGKCDARGRFWAGTQSLDHAPGHAGLYRLELDGSARQILAGVSISNGIGWSPDNRTMYYVDTLTGGLDAFAFDLATGSVRDRHRLVDIPPADGLPDGLAIDVDGCVWLALWGGAMVRCFAPTGRCVRTIPTPVKYPTSCAFGGRDLDTLYITSAKRQAGEALGGSLFAIRPGVSGLPPQVYRGPSASSFPST
jgi:sugar lactone lactonase YvrE